MAATIEAAKTTTTTTRGVIGGSGINGNGNGSGGMEGMKSMKVPAAATSLQKIAEFRVAARGHIIEWENKSELARDVRDDDRSVERFLIARKFDIPNALQMWLDAMKWRYEGKLDTVLHDPRPHLLDIRSSMDNHCEHKYDKFGRPIYIEWVGKLDVNKVLPRYNIDAVMEYQFHASEFRRKVLFQRGSALSGQPVDQIVSIVDLKGIEFGKHLTKPVYEFIKKLSACNQSYYPEFLGALYIINAPAIFRLAWVVIRPWLDSRTQSKIQILSDDGREQLLKIMSPESLPSSMGGRCQCQVTPLARQCAATSVTMIPKKVVAKKSSKTTTSTSTSTTTTATTRGGSDNGINEVTHDCANSSVEQLAYYTISLHGLAAYDPSLMPVPLSSEVASTTVVALSSLPTSSSSKLDHCNVADVKLLSTSDKQAMEPATISTTSNSNSNSNMSSSSSSNNSSVILAAPAALVTNHHNTHSNSTSNIKHVVLIPTPAPPILDEDSYDYTKDSNSSGSGNSMSSSSSSSSNVVNVLVKRSSLSIASTQKVDDDDMELKQRADTNDIDIDIDNNDDNATNNTNNELVQQQQFDMNVSSATPTPSRRFRDCGVPMNMNCLQRIRTPPPATTTSKPLQIATPEPAA